MEFETCEVSFDCVMPSAIFFNDQIEPAAIKCYAMIRNLAKMNGYCYASNPYLCGLLNCGLTTLKKWISSLEAEGFIEIEHVANFEKDNRHIYISSNFKKCLRRPKNGPPLDRNPTGGSPKSGHINKEYPKESEIKEDLTSSSEQKKEKTGPSAQASALAEEFYFALKDAHGEDFKKPNLEKWAKDFELLLRIDKAEPSIIRKVMNWAVNDSFWRSNILSSSKLRKQFLTLKLQMERPKIETKKSLKSQEAKWTRQERDIPAENDILAQLLVK
jgi:hypothetical protein